MTRHGTVMNQAARAGGKIITKYFGRSLRITEKTAAHDVRTQADTGSEREILKIIRRSFPDYGIIAEESGQDMKDSVYTFIIDPLDGTFNFVVGIPYFSVAIALLRNDTVIASTVYNPILNQLYYAEAGKGARMNGRKISVSKTTTLPRAAVAYNGSYDVSRHHPTGLKILDRARFASMRAMTNWSPALDFCLLARGTFDVIINNACEPYDFLAGKLIAREAGARITDFCGKGEKNDMNDRFIVTNNTRLHSIVINLGKR